MRGPRGCAAVVSPQDGGITEGKADKAPITLTPNKRNRRVNLCGSGPLQKYINSNSGRSISTPRRSIGPGIGGLLMGF